MAYIGTKPTVGNFQICDAISVVNGQAAYTMQVGSVNVIPQSANHMIVSLNGTIQKPNSSFTVSGSTITFASNLATGDVIDFIQILGDVLDLGVPSDDTVTAAKIGANAVTAAKLNNDIISGSTELASEPADTDEFLVSDAGTLKRIDYSLIKATSGLSMVDQWRMTADKSNVGTSNTVFDSNLEQIDTGGQSTVGSAMTESSGVFTFPSTGKYLIIAKTNYYRDSDRRFCKLQIDIGVGGSFTQLAQGYGHIKVINSNHTYINVICSTIVAIGNTSNDTVRFVGAGDAEITAEGSTSTNKTTFTFIKLN
jgi:hypothetical protein